jgi:hypothetical protein
MRQHDYCRLHEACLAMAEQSTEPEVHARWLAMADAWLKRSMELNEYRGVMKHGPSKPWGHTGPQSTGAPDRGQRLTGPVR